MEKKTARRATTALLLSLTALAPAASVVPPASAAPAASPSCQRTLSAYPVLRPGARGPAVRTLQCVLNDAGFGPVAVDGSYGPQTRAAVARVEAGFEGAPLHPGRVDDGYWVLLFAHHLPDRTLKLGDHGAAVVTLQRALRAAGGHLAVDGSFGPQTRGVVRGYQQHLHAPVTGRTDAQTRFLLGQGATLG